MQVYRRCGQNMSAASIVFIAASTAGRKLALYEDSTGTLYGRGTYLAESITKADEPHSCITESTRIWVFD